MPADGHQLGIDFGTSNTVAVLRWPDGRARSLLFDGSPLLPSAVYAEPAGGLVVGRDAVLNSRLDPARFEPNPKRRIDDGTLLLGEREVTVVDAIAAVLARVAEEVTRAVGGVRPRATLTCPAAWGAPRRRVLTEAAARAGFTEPRLVAEPVAAATYFASVLGREVPIGSVVVVHDLGAGTFDASVVARTSSGFDVLAVDGRDDVGGLDVDAAVIAHIEKQYGDAMARLRSPSTVEERRAKLLLWDDVRAAKERLSRSSAADLVVPLADLQVHLTRDELESLARPLLAQTVQVTEGVIRWANLAPGRLAGVFLVGGSSRIPLLATLLHRTLGEPPVVLEQPELVVAEGSIHAAALAMPVDSGSAAPGPSTGVLPRIPAEAFGPAGVPFAAGAPLAAGVPLAAGAPLAAAAPVSPGVVAPVSPAVPPSSPAVPSPASAAPAVRSIGRVVVPGARPPARRAAVAPLAPTKPLPRVTEPPPPPAPVAARPVAARPVAAPRPVPPVAAPRPVRRRRAGRFAFRLFVLLVLAAVPVVSAALAYYLTTDELPDVRPILDWLRDLRPPQQE